MARPKRHVKAARESGMKSVKARKRKREEISEESSAAMTDPPSTTRPPPPPPPTPSPPPLRPPTSAEKRKKGIKKESEKEITDIMRCFHGEEKTKIIVSNMACKECFSTDIACEFTHRQIDLGTKIYCKECKYKIFDDNKESEISVKGAERVHSVTLVAVYYNMQLGFGYRMFPKFCGNFSMKNVSKPVYVRHANFVTKKAIVKVKDILEKSREHLIKFYKDILGREAEDGILDIEVTYDGSWQKRGHNSNMFVGAVIDANIGYVIDYVTLCKVCVNCDAKKTLVKKGKMTSEEFSDWHANHDCDINYKGSSGGMEVEGAVQLWSRSLENGFRYMSYISDGDSKGYFEVCKLNNGEGPYGKERQVKKEECVNHVSKRLGTALRKICQHPAQRKDGRKTLGGKGRLTEKVIKKLTYYFGKNVKEKTNTSPKEMRDTILSSFYHTSSSDENPKHDLCPKSKTSWCFYQEAIANNKTPKPHSIMRVRFNLEEEELKQVEEVYKRLSSDDLLIKCMRGKTQNTNESLHSRIWRLCPKNKSTRKTYLDFAAAQAISYYNAGHVESNLNDLLGIPYSKQHHKLLEELDKRMDAPNKKKSKLYLPKESMYGAGMF